jgi:hypothetical protein
MQFLVENLAVIAQLNNMRKKFGILNLVKYNRNNNEILYKYNILKYKFKKKYMK